MKIYRFSPIKDEKELLNAVKYVTRQSVFLCKKTLGKTLPVKSLTIFSHYDHEYKKLFSLLKSMGKRFNENNGPRIVLNNPIIIGKNKIEYLRIRKPDTYRMQTGCCDFIVDDYNDFKKTSLHRNKTNLRLIKRDEYEMIEFFDPDFDVLAYVVSKCIH